MTTVLLPCLPAPTPEMLVILRAAKALIDTETKITPVEAVPDMGDVTILNFGVWPIPWAHDSIYVRPESTANVERVSAALAHWLNGGAPTYTTADILSLWMGCRVEEVTDQLHRDHLDYTLDLQGVRFSNGR